MLISHFRYLLRRDIALLCTSNKSALKKIRTPAISRQTQDVITKLKRMDLTNKLYKVFLIAGSEPLGTAGMQADIKSISACGGYAAGAITCIVDEDTIKVKSIQTIPVEMVVSQTYSFLEDVGADCIKTGMLYSQELVTAIGDVVKNSLYLSW